MMHKILSLALLLAAAAAGWQNPAASAGRPT